MISISIAIPSGQGAAVLTSGALPPAPTVNGLNGGNATTLNFTREVDGGDAFTTVFGNEYNGGDAFAP